MGRLYRCFLRAVSYTDFFITSGRGKYTKVRVKDLFKKFDLLVSEKFKFKSHQKEVETKGISHILKFPQEMI